MIVQLVEIRDKKSTVGRSKYLQDSLDQIVARMALRMIGKSHASSTKPLLCHEGFLWTTFSGVDGSWGHIVITYVQWIAHWVWKCAIFWSQCSTWSDWSQWKFTLIRWWSITCTRLGDTGNAWHIEYAVAWGFVFSIQILCYTFSWIIIIINIIRWKM